MNLISEKVIHYGRFLETFEKVCDLMRSEYQCSVIIRGNPGSGKKTVIYEALKSTKVKGVFVSPEQYSDDYAAIRAIASDLNFDVNGRSISVLMENIREFASKGKKLVIILEDFEDLCSRRQSLLYNLMDIMHSNPSVAKNGPNLTIIGLTCSLEWAEDIEKRVRSRLNAKCIDLRLPYSNLNEYIQFASLLLDGHKIKGEFYEQLEYMYFDTSRSVRALKKYLINICDFDAETNKLKINFDPESYRDDYQTIQNNLTRERLRHLTRPQLDLVKIAVHYCYTYQKITFTLRDLKEACLKKGTNVFDFSEARILRDTALLLKLRMFKPQKPEQLIGIESPMCTGLMPLQLKYIVDGDPTLQHSKTDSYWSSLN